MGAALAWPAWWLICVRGITLDRSTVDLWQASGAQAPLDLPAVNAYLRRVTYEQLASRLVEKRRSLLVLVARFG